MVERKVRTKQGLKFVDLGCKFRHEMGKSRMMKVMILNLVDQTMTFCNGRVNTMYSGSEDHNIVTANVKEEDLPRTAKAADEPYRVRVCCSYSTLRSKIMLGNLRTRKLQSRRIGINFISGQLWSFWSFSMSKLTYLLSTQSSVPHDQCNFPF